MLPGLADKVAIVTGHRSGIGAAIEALLREQGCRVHGFDLPEVDLRDLGAIEGHVERVVAAEGRVDILVNNAGVTHLGNLVDTSLEDLDAVLTVNLKAPFLLMKAVIPHMVRQGKGAIVNNASDQAFIGKKDSAIYGASKAAIAQLTMSAALDWGPRGIRVNCVAPGSTDTPMLRRVVAELSARRKLVEGDAYKDAGDSYKDAVPLGRFADPREIAWAVAFLASDAASFMTGVVMPVDGGGVAQ
ncbi:SDR family NAD(P)-dependent oxidoreductase [Chondromyces apiculatus]|uniref:3-oxoacyl-[acyl-carrier protein] reductase n=1 Tax=Chondromyces apiculatus DSM 436 TaxID=1192034 RepID=A0A017THE8_9BACT|nr:SDR family oxidoreductase [Chondromyces apiculatus]EYF08664.1 3-oxoacyl-[acyl-carrier protein] reductase [Chondromyces apiculatus DSM 436]